jgi:hypothetical protein
VHRDFNRVSRGFDVLISQPQVPDSAQSNSCQSLYNQYSAQRESLRKAQATSVTMTTSPIVAPSLASTHPLILELSSLRQQLHQYQKAAHQSAIQLQGARLELSLAREETASSRNRETQLRTEVETLRCVSV